MKTNGHFLAWFPQLSRQHLLQFYSTQVSMCVLYSVVLAWWVWAGIYEVSVACTFRLSSVHIIIPTIHISHCTLCGSHLYIFPSRYFIYLHNILCSSLNSIYWGDCVSCCVVLHCHCCNNCDPRLSLVEKQEDEDPRRAVQGNDHVRC